MKKQSRSASAADFLARAGESAVATALQSLLLFLRLKIVSMAVGAGGVGILALGQAHQNVFVGLSNLSAGNAFTRDISTAESHNEKRKLLSLCSFMGLFNGLVMGLAGAVFWFLLSDVPGNKIVWSTAIFISIVALSNFNQMVYALRGLRRTSAILNLNFKIFIIGLMMFAGLLELGVTEVWKFFSVIPVATLLGITCTKQFRYLYAGLFRKNPIIDLWNYLRKNKVAWLFVGSLVVTSAQLAYRWAISERFGLEALGYFQAAWMISSIVMVVNTNIMTSVYLPSLNNRDKYSQVRDSLRQIFLNLAVLTSVICVFIFFGEKVITLVTSADLLPALQVLYVLFIADLFRCVVSTLGLLLFHRKDLTAFLGIDIIGAVTPVLLLVLFEFSHVKDAVLWSCVPSAVVSLIFIVYRMNKLGKRSSGVK